MRWLTIAASLALAGGFTASAASAARGGQTAASASSSSPSQTKRTSHKRKHYSKRQPTQKAPTSDRISEIQSALSREGYYQSDPNGKLDSNTVAALQKFQSANGLDASGKLDAPTLQKLGLGSDIAGVAAPKPVVPSCCSMASPGSTPPSGTPAMACCSAAAATKSPVSSADPSPGSAPNGAASSDPKSDQK
ncbi:MAG TPA: peptidoglycan-binding domain-containing protein [Candidatus Acidoferrum sp.]|nr:peptidoglycan-binding domain-containing protein [Candidatus Acidoferrum sp.]